MATIQSKHSRPLEILLKDETVRTLLPHNKTDINDDLADSPHLISLRDANLVRILRTEKREPALIEPNENEGPPTPIPPTETTPGGSRRTGGNQEEGD